jgi:hypothetical protein
MFDSGFRIAEFGFKACQPGMLIAVNAVAFQAAIRIPHSQIKKSRAKQRGTSSQLKFSGLVLSGLPELFS